MEESADHTMAELGDRNTAASALLKLKYFELFEWEDEAADGESMFLPEQPKQDILRQKINNFNGKLKDRSSEWNRLAEVEIISRTASHPTLKMRLDSLGVNDFQIIEAVNSSEYTENVQRALKYVDEMIYKDRLESYSEDRANFYLKPKATVEDWVSNGEPVCATDYADVDASLRQLGMISKSEKLCDRAISELPEVATYYALYIKGSYLLHRYDPSGLDLIYKAMENNSNYIDEGLEVIGLFCCMTGYQAGLNQYREKAVILAQKQKDEYSQMSDLKKGDNLSSEHLPSDLLSGILSYARSIDNGVIEKMYLVRKTISKDFFTSPLVICFADGTDDEFKNDVLHKLFCYLDTCGDWQFSLFDFSGVSSIKFDSIPDSCIYQKQ